MNQIKTIAEAGRKAGIAANNRDYGMRRELHLWAMAAIKLDDNPKAARKAYDDAYSEAIRT